MGRVPRKKIAARKNAQRARQKLAERGVAARGSEGENAENEMESAESSQKGGPVYLSTVMAEDIGLGHPVFDSKMNHNYDVAGPSGQGFSNHPQEANPNPPDTEELEARMTVDIQGDSHTVGHFDEGDSDLGTAESNQHHEDDMTSGGQLAAEDSDPDNSEYKIKVETRQISELEAKQLVAAIEKAQAGAEAAYQHDKEAKRPVIDELTKRRIFLMTTSLNLLCYLNSGITEASLTAAAALGLGPWAARMARKWIRQFQATGKLPENLYRK